MQLYSLVPDKKIFFHKQCLKLLLYVAIFVYVAFY